MEDIIRELEGDIKNLDAQLKDALSKREFWATSASNIAGALNFAQSKLEGLKARPQNVIKTD